MTILKYNNMIVLKYNFYLKGKFQYLKISTSNDKAISKILGGM